MSDFIREPDELDGRLESLAAGDFSCLAAGTVGNVQFLALNGLIGGETVVALEDTNGIAGPWASCVTFTAMQPVYNQATVSDQVSDTDNDGLPNFNDPDDDNDGIADELDPDPLTPSNDCTSGDSNNATMAEVVSTKVVCAAQVSIDVQGSTQVVGPDGHLLLYAPTLVFRDGFFAFSLTASTINPCPLCAL